jgi:glycosyltransferase involved in cell wall biosynthesis
MSISRVMYMSAVDVARPDGPGVNEREFLLALVERFGSGTQIVAPPPSSEVEASLHAHASWLWNPSEGTPTFLGLQRAMYLRGIQALDAHRPDLLIVRAGPLPIGLRHLLRARPIPYVVKTLGGGTMSGPTSNRLLRALGYPHRAQLRQILSGALLIDACTEELCRRIRRDFGIDAGRVLLVPNATNTERFTPGDAEEARRKIGLPVEGPILGFAGGRPWERGGDEIIRAVGLLRAQWPTVAGLIVGGGAGLSALRELASSLGVAERIHFAGTVPYSQVPDYIRAMSVGVALDAPDRLGEVGNSNQKVRQYLAVGLPVVTSMDDQLDVEAEGLGRHVAPRDATGLAEAVLTLLDVDLATRQTRSAAARSLAVKDLSTASALDRRIAAWHAAIEGRRR